MTGLLPHVVREAVENRSVSGASRSFGVVALIILIVLQFEGQAIRVARPSSDRLKVLSAFWAPLLVVAALTIVARLALIVR